MENMKDRAKRIIEKILYITITTSSADGLPWSSPVYSAFDRNYNFFWASDQNSQHSKNIRENNNIFIVIHDSTVPEEQGEGVYIKAKAYELSNKEEIAHGLKCLDERVGKKPHSLDQFFGNMPRRVYKAVPEKSWFHYDGEVNGNYIDIRLGVNLLKKR